MSSLVKYIVHFTFIFLIQVLLLQSISLPIGRFYLSVFIFPLFIILLPFETEAYVGLLVAFGLGLLTDMFYDSPGVFASAGVFAAFVRPLVLTLNEPKTGYARDASPVISSMGLVWFLRFSIPLVLCFVLFYCFIEVFTFRGMGNAILKTLISVPISLILTMLYVIIFNPRL